MCLDQHARELLASARKVVESRLTHGAEIGWVVRDRVARNQIGRPPRQRAIKLTEVRHHEPTEFASANKLVQACTLAILDLAERRFERSRDPARPPNRSRSREQT